MYVIQVSGAGEISAINKRANVSMHIPAERCTWEQTYSNGANHYGINHVYYWHFTGSTESTRLDGVANIDCELGYIGKSGRFVPIAT